MESNSTVEQIVAYIKENILNGHYKSHEKLTERVLCEHFNVSRMMIRQAFLILKESGWVYSKSKSGTYVSDVDRTEVIENYRARLSLEPVILEMAFPNITDEDIKYMKNLLELISICPSEHYYENEHELHMIFARRTNNRYILIFFEAMLTVIKRLAVLSSSVPSRVAQSLEEWNEIVNALDNKNPQIASLWLSRHILNSYLSFLKNNPE